MAHRFKNVDIATVTLDNVNEVLPESLFLQLEFFLPPEGSFDDGCLQRYLTILKQYEEEDENSHMTLANRLRLAFQEPTPATICGKFPQAELPLKRRLRCVAEYLIRSGELDKVKDENDKVKTIRSCFSKDKDGKIKIGSTKDWNHRLEKLKECIAKNIENIPSKSISYEYLFYDDSKIQKK